MIYLRYKNKKDKTSPFKSYFLWYKQLSTNKFIEIESFYDNFYLFEFWLELKWKGYDHAGPHVSINLFGQILSVSIYDTRHWNHITDDWLNN
jgi:hypothetical protein